MGTARRRLAMVWVAVLGCGGGGQGETSGGGTSGTGGTSSGGVGMSETGGGPSGGTTTSTTGAPTSGVTTAVDSSECMLDVAGNDEDCDAFAQDCPPCEKCSAFANDGGQSWNDAKCVPVVENPKQPGEPCIVEGNGVSGIDDCDFGAYCWNVDPETNIGECVAMCTGGPEAPVCDRGFICLVSQVGVLNLCLGLCDPLAEDCEAGDVCLSSPQGNGFICVLDASGEEGQQHDPCMFANSCDPGLVCLVHTAADECEPDAQGCCQPYCDLRAMDPDEACWIGSGGLDNGQTCQAFFEEAPEGFENVGACALPDF